MSTDNPKKFKVEYRRIGPLMDIFEQLVSANSLEEVKRWYAINSERLEINIVSIKEIK